ncbi:hypothetical protein HOLleu_15572 [Holothuria leucospilota]|uniref:Uncharacterized protein n=1 Tax=Holothuria leucospilota TaxID=206669 RepID=A0A9Q1C405_HOLLE|nr:hypothetical protein HOLleu_15572 [Holothuria leucospilota]
MTILSFDGTTRLLPENCIYFARVGSHPPALPLPTSSFELLAHSVALRYTYGRLRVPHACRISDRSERRMHCLGIPVALFCLNY